jgi:surface protein
LRKKYKHQGFNADFTRKIFGPFILNQLSRCDGDIQADVNLWCSDPAAVEKKYGHISKWGVPRVTNTMELFAHCCTFNEDIGVRDVSRVTSMKYMFYNATSVNQPLDNWNMAKVENMRFMFCEATSFNQDVGVWDVNNVTSLAEMFEGATTSIELGFSKD